MEIPSFIYIPPVFPHLRQAEVIADLYELRPQIPAGDNVQPDKFDPIDHPYSVVVSQDCDLEWDYKARQSQAPTHKLLEHVLFCALFPVSEIQDRSGGSQLFKRMRQNQDERYHSLVAAPVNGLTDGLPWLFADFKMIFSLPLAFAYWQITSGQATRKGSLPSPYLEDLIHRLYTFLGRVATPPAQREEGV